MNGELLLGMGSALWLGILTSISPCPLATSVAAVSFLGRRVDRPRSVFGGGLLYAPGRALAYVALGAPGRSKAERRSSSTAPASADALLPELDHP